MAWELDGPQQQQIGALSNQFPFVWLFEVRVPSDSASRIRIANYTKDVTFGQDSTGADIVYTKWPFQVEDLNEDSGASLPTITVTVSNITREIQAFIEEYDGLVGQQCELQLVNVSTLASGAYLEYTGEVIALQADESAVALEVGSYNLQRQVFPSNRALKNFCRHRYQGNRCGYTGSLPTCDKSLNGPDGCVVHGNEPRFGGFPSIPRPGGL